MTQASKTTQYLSGLRRGLVQTVLHQASPQRRDVVQAQTYEGLGRETKAYLPYADSARLDPLGYHAWPLNHQQAFCASNWQLNPARADDPMWGIARTRLAFAETIFEALPLNRVLAQGELGEAWQFTEGHITECQERPNTAQDTPADASPARHVHRMALLPDQLSRCPRGAHPG